jgi:hypothetical protein
MWRNAGADLSATSLEHYGQLTILECSIEPLFSRINGIQSCRLQTFRALLVSLLRHEPDVVLTSRYPKRLPETDKLFLQACVAKFKKSIIDSVADFVPVRVLSFMIADFLVGDILFVDFLEKFQF